MKKGKNMNIIQKQIEDLMLVLEKTKENAIQFETVGALAIKSIFHNVECKIINDIGIVQFMDKETNTLLIIQIYLALEIQINRKMKEYGVLLPDDLYIKMKIMDMEEVV